MVKYLETKDEKHLIRLANRVSVVDCLSDSSLTFYKLKRGNSEDKLAEIGSFLLSGCARVHGLQGDMQGANYASLSYWILDSFPMWKMIDVVSFIKFIGDNQYGELKCYGKPDMNYMKKMAGEYNAFREDERIRAKSQHKTFAGRRYSTTETKLEHLKIERLINEEEKKKKS